MRARGKSRDARHWQTVVSLDNLAFFRRHAISYPTISLPRGMESVHRDRATMVGAGFGLSRVWTVGRVERGC